VFVAGDAVGPRLGPVIALFLFDDDCRAGQAEALGAGRVIVIRQSLGLAEGRDQSLGDPRLFPPMVWCITTVWVMG